jgi:hypothetical protein
MPSETRGRGCESKRNAYRRRAAELEEFFGAYRGLGTFDEEAPGRDVQIALEAAYSHGTGDRNRGRNIRVET